MFDAFHVTIYGGRYFRCRQCHRLKYASQNENSAQRAMQRADRIANRLHDMWGGKTKAEYDFPLKPKRMRWVTYKRLPSSTTTYRSGGLPP
jgi:hypothetical protein